MLKNITLFFDVNNKLTKKEKKIIIKKAVKICESGGMADTQVSDACGRNTLWVQIPSLAPV